MTFLQAIMYPFLNLIYLYSIHIFLSSIFNLKNIKNSIHYKMAIGIYYIVVLYGFFMFAKEPYIQLGINLLCTFILSLFYVSGYAKKLLVTAALFVIGTAAEAVVLIIYSSLTNQPLELAKADGALEMFLVAISKIVMLFTIMLFRPAIRKLGSKNKLNLKLPYWIMVFTVPTSSIFMIYTIFQNFNYKKPVIALTIALMLLFNFLVFYLYDLLLAGVLIEQENLLLFQQNKMFEQYLYEMEQNQNEIRAMRHDMTNILLGLLAQAESENLYNKKAIQNAFQETLGQIKARGSKAQSGFPAVDVILNYKANYATQSSVTIDAKIGISNLDGFDAKVITQIIGIALDNAIEACQNVLKEERRITVSIFQRDSNLYIYVSNPYKGKILLEDNGRLRTQKIEGGHGIGLKSITRLIDANEGLLSIDYANQIFTLQIILSKSTSSK